MSAPAPRWPGLIFVVLLHAAALYGLWQHRLLPSPLEAAALFVNFIAPPAPQKVEQPKQPPPPRPRPIEKPQTQQLVAATPIVAATDYVAPAPPKQEPVIDAPRMPLAAGPVALGSELSVACPERAPPSYPATSRRLGESGIVVLRVELDEQGLVSTARIDSASGFERLDQAALAAVRTWRCNPPRRNGEPVRAIARQAFHFVLQGS